MTRKQEFYGKIPKFYVMVKCQGSRFATYIININTLKVTQTTTVTLTLTIIVHLHCKVHGAFFA